jgi:hypothetical protein
VGVGNPAEETCCHPNTKSLSARPDLSTGHLKVTCQPSRAGSPSMNKCQHRGEAKTEPKQRRDLAFTRVRTQNSPVFNAKNGQIPRSCH